VLASVALAMCPTCERSDALYVVASSGKVCCVNPNSGLVDWTFNTDKSAQGQPQLLSSPALVNERTNAGERHYLYFGAGLNDAADSTAAVYCLEDETTDR